MNSSTTHTTAPLTPRRGNDCNGMQMKILLDLIYSTTSGGNKRFVNGTSWTIFEFIVKELFIPFEHFDCIMVHG